MDYWFLTVDRTHLITSVLFNCLTPTQTWIKKTIGLILVTSAVSPCSSTTVAAVGMSGKASCSAVTCGPVSAAVLSILSENVWVAGLGLVIASQAAVGELLGDRVRWRQWRRGMVRESVISFRLFSLWHASASPYCLSVSADDWQRNSSATDKHIRIVCVCVYSMYSHGWMQVLTHKTMPCPYFARSAYPHSYDQALQC